MFKRFVRWIRSVFGGAISSLEDPVLILEQNMRDMRDQIPKMNENVAMIKGNVTLLQRELDKLADEEKVLISNIKAAIAKSRDDIAADYAATLEHVRASKVRTDQQMKAASMAFDKAAEVKKMFVREMEKKNQQAMLAIQDANRAKWQKQVADAMESFEVGGIDQTHDEMIRKIDQESAVSEARLDLAMGKVDTDKLKIQEDGDKLRADELVKQFKVEMGMVDDKPADVGKVKQTGG